MVQIEKNQCPSNREFPEFFKTHPTLICRSIVKTSRSLQTKLASLSDRTCNCSQTFYFNVCWEAGYVIWCLICFLTLAREEVVSVYHCVSPTEDGVVWVTGDGGERALTGAGVTRGEEATDAASALLRVSGGAGTVGCCCGGPGGNGTRGCCVMGLLLYFLMTI